MNERERKEMEKYIKNFYLKCTQVIVQSRQNIQSKDGHVVRSQPPHAASANKDWFNFAIADDEQVAADVKAIYCPSQPLTVSIYTTSLGNPSPASQETSTNGTAIGATTDCECAAPQHVQHRLPFEVWTLNTDHHKADPRVRVHYAAYNRLGVLLKSLYSLTKVLPAYRFSRSISPLSNAESATEGSACEEASGNLFYEITCGEAPLDSAPPRVPPVGGAGVSSPTGGGDLMNSSESKAPAPVTYKCHSIGSVSTPLGGVTISVKYWQDGDLAGLSPALTVPGERSLEMKADHFDEVKGSEFKEKLEGGDKNGHKHENGRSNGGTKGKLIACDPTDDSPDSSPSGTHSSLNGYYVKGAFASSPQQLEDKMADTEAPFSELMKIIHKYSSTGSGTDRDCLTKPSDEPESYPESVPQIDLDELLSDKSDSSGDWLEFKSPPFASRSDENISNVGAFFTRFDGDSGPDKIVGSASASQRELSSLDTGDTIGTTLDHMPQQLAAYEDEGASFDQLMNRLS